MIYLKLNYEWTWNTVLKSDSLIPVIADKTRNWSSDIRWWRGRGGERTHETKSRQKQIPSQIPGARLVAYSQSDLPSEYMSTCYNNSKLVCQNILTCTLMSDMLLDYFCFSLIFLRTSSSHQVKLVCHSVSGARSQWQATSKDTKNDVGGVKHVKILLERASRDISATNLGQIISPVLFVGAWPTVPTTWGMSKICTRTWTPSCTGGEVKVSHTEISV